MKNQMDKLEKKALHALKNRELVPTPQAWDRIDAMLSTTEQKKSVKTFSWMKYAASFIILSGLVGLFYWQKGIEHIQTDIVNITHDDVKDATLETTATEQKILNNEKTLVISKEVASISKSNLQSENKQQINSTGITKPIVPHMFNDLPIENKSIRMTDDAQKLLAEVEHDLQNQKTKSNTDIASNSSKIKIDPNRLLDEAEYEMNQTFKEKAIDKINKQFKNLKEAFVKADE